MRNVFDQYEQPENKLTHALFTTLDRERSYLRPFLRYLGVPDIPALKSLQITEQQVPGIQEVDAEELDAKELEKRGLPDGCVFTDEGWAVLFESKVQAHVSVKQLRRHRKTAIRNGFESPHLVVIAVDEAPKNVPEGTLTITWKDVYRWFNKRSHEPWARELIRYMQSFERKMLAKNYEIRGTITVFDADPAAIPACRALVLSGKNSADYQVLAAVMALGRAGRAAGHRLLLEVVKEETVPDDVRLRAALSLGQRRNGTECNRWEVSIAHCTTGYRVAEDEIRRELVETYRSGVGSVALRDAMVKLDP